MTNIYLTSYGIDTRYEKYMDSYDEIIKVLKGKKVAVISNAKLKEQSRENSDVAVAELEKNRIVAELFDLDIESVNDIDEFSAIYFSGGEPKNLMDAIYRNNFYDKINRFIESGNVIIGQSAGAMIMNTVYVDTTTGKAKIQNNGFDFFNKVIIPHYDNLPDDLKKQLPTDTFNVLDNDKLKRI